MSKINIIFDNYQGCYYAGQTITGKLVCHFSKPEKFREITITCEGKEKTEWTESETYRNSTNNRSETRYQTYTGARGIYLNRISLNKSDENTPLPKGEFVYPFSFLLPNNLPSTYICEYGSIVYTVKARVDRPWKFDYVSNVAITVQSPIDLNIVSHVRNSFTLTDEKQVCCFWCKSGPVSIIVSVPQRGFAPGDKVTCSAYIKNLSNANVKSINLKLIKYMEYKVEFPSTKTKEDTYTMTCTSFGRIGAHAEHNFTLELCVPETCPVPNFSNCALFKAKYILAVEVVLPCPHINLSDKALVTMGSIKLRPNNFPPLPTPSAPAFDAAPSTVDRTGLIGNQEEAGPSAPPSYDEIMRCGIEEFPAPVHVTTAPLSPSKI